MGTWLALALATPIFGFTLTPPGGAVGAPPQVAAKPAPTLELAAAPEPEAGAGQQAASSGSEPEQAAEGPSFGEQMARRADMADIHKAFGIATWASMTLTLALGSIQFHNLYGMWDGQGSNPCVKGDAIFGQGQCTGTPWVHLSSALLTSALYGTTFTLSFLMPDPGGLDEGDSDFAKTLRTHKALRWVHFGGMLAQMLLGIVVANGQRFGLDRANDYKALRALSTVHLGIGVVTWGALTWAGSIMMF